MNQRRSSWYLVTGLVIGLVLGLGYGYLIAPISHVDTYPISLPDAEKDTLRLNIALAYQAGGDLGRAQTRLGLLGDPDPAASLNEQAQALYSSGDPQNHAAVLAALARDLSNQPVMEITSGEPRISQEIDDPLPSNTPHPDVATGISPTSTPLVTPTGLPSRTPTATPGSAFQLVEFELVCDPSITTPLLQIYAYDASRRPVAGVELIISWADQENHFFTGLKPEISLGYADYDLEVGVNYSLQMVDGGDPVQGITPSECEDENGDRYWGSIVLAFQQP